MIGSYILIPLCVGLVIQTIKMIIDYVYERKMRPSNFWRAGGFPSVHSGLSASMATLVALDQGIDSLLFAVVFTFSFLFRYDAMNVRYEAGKHAKLINEMSSELHHILALHEERTNHLKERLGHTFQEVVGGIIIGSLSTIVFYTIFVL